MDQWCDPAQGSFTCSYACCAINSNEKSTLSLCPTLAVTYDIDVSMNEAQFLHMCHFLLQQKVHLLFVFLQVSFLGFQCLKFSLQTGLDLFHLQSLISSKKKIIKRYRVNIRKISWDCISGLLTDFYLSNDSYKNHIAGAKGNLSIYTQ